jgi:hypothetical protein
MTARAPSLYCDGIFKPVPKWIKCMNVAGKFNLKDTLLQGSKKSVYIKYREFLDQPRN